jgi:hypothetical protein
MSQGKWTKGDPNSNCRSALRAARSVVVYKVQLAGQRLVRPSLESL